MQIETFGVEQWMNKWETRCDLNLAETCVASLTLAELMQMAGKTQTMPADLAQMKMTYGAITGSEALRTAIAGLYDGQNARNVMVAHGAIGANHLIYQTLVAPGDHVVAITPTYQQHTAIPRAIGADVTEVPLQETKGWKPDLHQLAAAMKPGTKLIALTNPNNPTGALLQTDDLNQIVEIARQYDAWILCDEVYRGTEQAASAPSISDLCDKGISTGSMSKAFSLAGLRLGWIVGAQSLLEAVEIHRDYTTISVGMIDDYFATMALENADQILERTKMLTRTNRAILCDWVAREAKVDMIAPEAGTTALLAIATDMPSYELCEAVIAATGVMLTPGSVMGMEGYVRIGYACQTDVLSAGLARLSEWLLTH